MPDSELKFICPITDLQKLTSLNGTKCKLLKEVFNVPLTGQVNLIAVIRAMGDQIVQYKEVPLLKIEAMKSDNRLKKEKEEKLRIEREEKQKTLVNRKFIEDRFGNFCNKLRTKVEELSRRTTVEGRVVAESINELIDEEIGLVKSEQDGQTEKNN